jgi:hypothetical protein
MTRRGAGAPHAVASRAASMTSAEPNSQRTRLANQGRPRDVADTGATGLFVFDPIIFLPVP